MLSVRPGVTPPPSLQNIFKELEADLGITPPGHGCLDHWARQGVLLLNAPLTVRQGRAASHQGKGWETFTDEVLRAVDDKPERVVFILWGAPARKKKALVDRSRHVVIESPHPPRCPLQRLLRQPPVLPGQRRAHRGRPYTGRLGRPAC